MTVSFPPQVLTPFFTPLAEIITPPAGEGVLIGSDPNRVLLVVTTVSGASMSIWPAPITGYDEGLSFAGSQFAYVFEYAKYGSLVGQSWYYWSGGSVKVSLLSQSYKPKPGR